MQNDFRATAASDQAPPQPATPSAAEQRCVLVLGMHRSGTSAVTRALQSMGAAMPGNLLKPASDNQEGFWESEAIVLAHDRFLAAVGSRWDDPRPLHASVFETPAAATCRTELLAVLQQEFAGKPLFVVKDPRISNLMPMWKRLLDNFGARPFVVLPIRNPIEVALSLHRRDGIAKAHSLACWLVHNLAAERDTRDLPRAFVTFNEFAANPMEAARRLCERLDCFGPDEIRGGLSEIANHWSPGLRHHAVGDEAVIADAGTPVLIRETYRWLVEAAEGGEPSPERIDVIAKTVDRALELYLPVFAKGMPTPIRRGRLGWLRKKLRR